MPTKWLIWEWQLCPSKEKRSKQTSSSWLTHISCRTEDASNKPFELASSQVLSDSPFPIFPPYSPSLDSCWIFLTTCLPLHWKHMAGAHTRRQVCSPCCLWRSGGASDRVLEGIHYSSSWSLLYFPSPSYTNISPILNNSTSSLLLPPSSRNPRDRREK